MFKCRRRRWWAWQGTDQPSKCATTTTPNKTSNRKGVVWQVEPESIEGKSWSITDFFGVSSRTSRDVTGQLVELPKNAAALFTQLTKEIGKLQDTQCRKKWGVSLDYKSRIFLAWNECWLKSTQHWWKFYDQFNIARKVGHNTTCSDAKRSRDEREVVQFMDSIPLIRQIRQRMKTHWDDHIVQRLYKVNTRETRSLNFVFSPHTFSRSTYFLVV